MIKIKIHKSREDKFKDSLKMRENENRPFVREKEDKIRDAMDYAEKYERIRKMQEEVAKITGDNPEDIHVWTNGCEDTFIGNIKEWSEEE